jgi:carbon monoxide dehydrogenase subunit G
MRSTGAWDRRRRAVPSTTVRLDDTIEVPVSIEDAWRFLGDTQAIASCIPGLVPGSVVEESPTRFSGVLRHVALGVPSTWNLVAAIERDQEAKTVDIHLEGKEPRLGLSLAGDAGLALTHIDVDRARLVYQGDLRVEGRLAGAGGPIIERVIASIIQRFLVEIGSAGRVPVHTSWWARAVGWLRRKFGADASA